MFDTIMDLFDRDRRHRGGGAREGGLRGVLGRLTDEHDDDRRPGPGRGSDRRRTDHDDWDDDRDDDDERGDRGRRGDRHRDGFDID